MKQKWMLLVIGMSMLLIAVPAMAQDTSVTGDLPWWNDRVFYEIFVRSFYDSDGDGIGDLRGVIEKLDYLNDGDPSTTTDLGVTGIWLMPVQQSPSYHGYDVTDYRTIEEDYGTNEDFLELMEAAHARGIAVIVDLVLNHTSDQHPWFRDSANNPGGDYGAWYIWRPANPGYLGPSSQQVWHARGSRFYYGVFWSGMPDLNYNVPAVTEEMYDVSRFWLEEMGVDGFRLDAIKHLIEDGREQENTPATLEWFAAYNDFLDSVNPDALTVGEVWSSNFISSQYVPDQVDLAFDFDLATAMYSAVAQNRPDAVVSVINRIEDLYPFGQFATFLTNHDQNRIMDQLRGNVDEAKTAASLLLTLPGVPFVYYGEEIGMTGSKPDERIRTPMRWDETPITAGFTTASAPWEPLSEDEAGVSVTAQTDDPNSLLNHYRALIQLRGQFPALAHGSITHLDVEGSRNVFAFLRSAGDQTVLVLINLDDETVTDYHLTLDASDITFSGAEVLYTNAAMPDEFIPVSGSLSAYAPYSTLPEYSTTITQLYP